MVAVWLACASIATAVVRFALVFRQNLQLLGDSEIEAATDALTGLGNRRALLRDLDRAFAGGGAGAVLALFDLDGFKTYNDTFGHVAGDALLARLGHNLAATTPAEAIAYRMGGDEFCLLSTGAERDPERARRARGRRPARIRRAVHGRLLARPVLLATECADPVDALRLADQRMYSAKRSGRRSSDEAVHQVLLRVAAEHDGELRDHVDEVADFAELVGRELGLADAELTEVRRAAQLHDIGKVAIPDAILHAPRALDESEWTYMRQHTIIGERIINAAPELRGRRAASSAPATSATTAPATRTARPARTSRSAPASSPSATPTTRWSHARLPRRDAADGGAGRARALRRRPVRPGRRRRLRRGAREQPARSRP